MGKIYDRLQKQLQVEEHREDAEDCIKIYNKLKEMNDGSVWNYEIQKDELNPVDGQPRFVRDIMIKCVETGVLVLYRMIESPLNSMYISK